ncbi:asparagine--tRNA ligase, cytoplasmic-like [Centruroides sculpturatus]|uniref:asparagine--tRNA ligase, cytoplasmic-like n=1 Tax=Centruroides sculpturatus TaxID=218467 RepID=UPI000C6DEE93|nr:asparagine--tRNA ligase, cytoplasmic-like [Centruroides sculpturatus]
MTSEITNNTDLLSLQELYTSEKFGHDEKGDGSENNPFKTVLQALRCAGKEPFPTIYVDGKSDDKQWDIVSQSQLKKVRKIWIREHHKNAEKAKKDAEDIERREKNLEEAKQIMIKEDKNLPEAIQVKIRDTANFRNKRIKVYGWVHRLRRQGKVLMFVTLRDGTGFLQCVLSDLLCQTYDALLLSTESSVCMYGTLKEVPPGKMVSLSYFLSHIYMKQSILQILQIFILIIQYNMF